MSLDCPTCGRGDAYYEASRGASCNDPWHGDAHLRRRATIDERPSAIRMRAETSRRMFEDMLQYFVHHWAPTIPRQRDDFQKDLMMLMRDAMQHQGNVYGMHIERTEMTLHHLAMASTSSLNAIFKENP